MRKPRACYVPSSSHKLAEMVKDTHAFNPLHGGGKRIHATLERNREQTSRLAGPWANADWAISQLSTQPFIAKGWPAPCRAARMAMRRKAA